MIKMSEIPKIPTIPRVSKMTKKTQTTQSKNRKRLHAGPAPAPVPRLALVVTAMILALSFGAATVPTAAEAQTAVEAQADARARENARQTARENAERRAYEEVSYAYALAPSAWSTGAEGGQVPQDIRIMQRIVHTALGEVEAPELSDALKESAETPEMPGAYVYDAGNDEATLWLADTGNRGYSIGGRDVTGFYMQGYGYLFTVKWRVTPAGSRFRYQFMYREEAADRLSELGVLAEHARQAAEASDEAEARAAGEAERALDQERERQHEQQVAWEEWAADYRDSLAEALREVVALYGSTLKRAAPEEAITFIADFGGGEGETVTVSTRRGQLTGASRDENLVAVQMSKGETGVTDTLRTELKIMAEIIDSSLQVEGRGDTWAYAVDFDEVRYFGGDSSYQYVPGYGALFRKGARLNMATQMIRRLNPDRRQSELAVETFREQMEEGTEEQRQAYTEHLAELKEKTAEILATYGPTLTGMNDDDWVGVFYDVGSAAGLLEGGISNFLVQATMADVRQAGIQADGADWLLDHLVTNEKQE